jgi:hypothetical protein
MNRSRDGIEPARMKWVTAEKPPQGKVESPDGSMLFDSFDCVVGTRWIKAACIRGKQGGDQ